MPVFWQSVLVEGARERNAAHEAASKAQIQQPSSIEMDDNDGPARLEATHTVPPQPAGALGEQYLAELRTRLARLASSAAQPIAEAAALCVAARARGNTAHTYLIGHFPVHQSGRPGDPMTLNVLEDGEKTAAIVSGIPVFSSCLSRACLGKSIIVYVKIL
jgi:hypothetical protein